MINLVKLFKINLHLKKLRNIKKIKQHLIQLS